MGFFMSNYYEYGTVLKAPPCRKELRRTELTRYQRIEKHFEQPLQKEAEEKMQQVRYTFVELPGMVMALGVTAVPAISSAYESDSPKFNLLINSVLKYTSILSCFSGIVITLMQPETAKGKIVFLESPSDRAQNTQLEARQHGKTVTAR